MSNPIVKPYTSTVYLIRKPRVLFNDAGRGGDGSGSQRILSDEVLKSYI
jgi:hypothetical protein